MAEKKVLVHLNLNQQQLLNASLQVLGTPPTNPAPVEGQIYWNSVAKTAYVWTGTEWLDLGQVYTHPTYTGSSQPASPTTGGTIISSITLTNGHVTGVTTRTLTNTDVGAAAASHTHAFNEIINLPANTILANNTTSTGPAKAITVADLMAMLSIAYGTATQLSTGTDTSNRTWTAKDLNDWVATKLTGYLKAVNLGLGTRTATDVPITNTAGTGVTIPAATTSLAGVMTSADKAKLDGITTGANNYVHPTNNPGAHPFATELTSGLKVLSQLVVNTEGHVITVKGRNLTAADIASVMIVAGTNTTETNATWSASTINTKLQAAINEVKTGALNYKGDYNPTTNSPALATDTTIRTGYTYVVSNAGTFAGQQVEAGDMIISKVDNPGSTDANWQIVNKNIPAIVSATETIEGIVYLASVAEAQAGTNTTKAVTPAGLKAVLSTGNYVTKTGTNDITDDNWKILGRNSLHGIYIDDHENLALGYPGDSGNSISYNDEASLSISATGPDGITLNAGTNGINVQSYISSNNYIVATKFIKSGGTASQVLMADGSVKEQSALLSTYIGGYYQTFGDGSSTSFTITHNLGTDKILVQTRVVATKEEVILDWKAASANTVTINTNIAPGAGAYEILITKI